MFIKSNIKIILKRYYKYKWTYKMNKSTYI